MAVILIKDKYKVQTLNEGISLSEAIDGVSYTAIVKLVETQELKNIGFKKISIEKFYFTKLISATKG